MRVKKESHHRADWRFPWFPSKQSSELSYWNQLHYNKELNESLCSFMTSSISYMLKTLDYYFPLVLTDEWCNISSAAVCPSSTLSPSHEHVTLHVRSGRVMCESGLTHVCRRLLDCYGWLNHRGVDVPSWPRWKVQWLRSFFFFVLLSKLGEVVSPQ